jgi:hypothetical protein
LRSNIFVTHYKDIGDLLGFCSANPRAQSVGVGVVDF